MLVVLAAPGLAAAAPPKVPRDAPVCARPGTRPIFLSPMGEPFRTEPGKPYPSAVWFAAADADHDNIVSRAEMIADARRFFATLDLNHDGKLTPDEVAAYEQDIAPETSLLSTGTFDPYDRSRRRTFGGISESREYGGRMGAGRYAWLNIPEPVAAADQDMDRIVTLKEFEEAAASSFDRLNVLGKAGLKLADLPRTPQQMAIEGPCRTPKRRDREE